MLLAEINSEEGARPTERQELLAPGPQQVRSDMQGAARRRGAGQQLKNSILIFPQILEGLLATPSKLLPIILVPCSCIQRKAVFIQFACWDVC